MPQDINPNRLNIYICPKCRGHIVTKDIDKGVTPFLIRCEATIGCDGKMQSSFYRVFDPDGILAHTHEWYSPTVLANMSPMTIEHVAKGGLILRRVKYTVAANDDWRPTHRHAATGGVYRVIDEGKMQSASWHDAVGVEVGDSIDMAPVVIYEAQDGTKWVRPKTEFEERFQAI